MATSPGPSHYRVTSVNSHVHVAVFHTRHLSHPHLLSPFFLTRGVFSLSISSAVKPSPSYSSPFRHDVAATRTDSILSKKAASLALLAAEKEEAKAVLTLFLKKQGLSSVAASRTISKSDIFIEHLVSTLHSIHKSRYLVGRELTTLEIRDAIVPYLESLLQEHGTALVDVVEKFPNINVEEKLTADVISRSVPLDVKELPDIVVEARKLRALARVSGSVPLEELPQHVIYLIELGMDLEEIQLVIRKFPAFAYYSLEGKVKPVVEFLLDIGVQKSDIPIIIRKRPQLCGISLSENLIPTMKFLEDLGLDKSKWAKVIYRFPPLLTYSRQKLMSTINFLYEKGLSEEDVGKVLTRCPNIISYSVEGNLRPTAEYFSLLGLNVAILLYRSPQSFGLSIEKNLKPVTEFFLQKGYSLEDLRLMIQRYGTLYTFSLEENLMPKWDFFLTMDYPRTELVKFPQFFGYSLEQRIKPRFALVRQCGVTFLLNQVLSLSDSEFDRTLKLKLKKKGANGSNAQRDSMCLISNRMLGFQEEVEKE